MVSTVQKAEAAGFPSIAYIEQGSGEAIVFLHGIGGNKANWQAQLDFFSNKYRAIAWDARGYGDSDEYEGPCRFEDFSQDLCRFLQQLNITKAHLVGLSMGGRILMDFAVHYPQYIQSLTFAGSFPSFGKALSKEQQDNYMQLRREPLLQGKQVIDIAPDLVKHLTGPNASAAARQAVTDSIRLLRPHSYLKTLEATLEFDRTDALGQIKAPTLLLYGEHDSLVTPEAGREVHALIPHAQYHVLPDTGHLMNLENPGTFNQVLEDFISKL